MEVAESEENRKGTILSKYDNVNKNPEGFFIKTAENTDNIKESSKESEYNSVKERLQQLKQEKERSKENNSKANLLPDEKEKEKDKNNFSLNIEKVKFIIMWIENSFRLSYQT